MPNWCILLSDPGILTQKPVVFYCLFVFFREFNASKNLVLSFFSKTYSFLIEGKLLPNIVLASAIHQHESAVGIHVSPPSWSSLQPLTPSHPSRLLLSPGLSSLSHTAYSRRLSVLHMVVYMLPCHSLHSSRHLHALKTLSLFSMSASPLLPCK